MHITVHFSLPRPGRSLRLVERLGRQSGLRLYERFALRYNARDTGSFTMRREESQSRGRGAIDRSRSTARVESHEVRYRPRKPSATPARPATVPRRTRGERARRREGLAAGEEAWSRRGRKARMPPRAATHSTGSARRLPGLDRGRIEPCPHDANPAAPAAGRPPGRMASRWMRTASIRSRISAGGWTWTTPAFSDQGPKPSTSRRPSHGDRHVPMPGHSPVGPGRLVEEEAAHREAVGTEHRLGHRAYRGRSGSVRTAGTSSMLRSPPRQESGSGRVASSSETASSTLDGTTAGVTAHPASRTDAMKSSPTAIESAAMPVIPRCIRPLGHRPGVDVDARPVDLSGPPRGVPVAALDQGMILVASRGEVRDQVEDLLARQLVEQPLGHDRRRRLLAVERSRTS